MVPDWAEAQSGEEQPRDLRVYLEDPMRPNDPRVAQIKTALDALPGISNSTNVYGNRITLTRVPAQTVSLREIQTALHDVDAGVNLTAEKATMWGPWVVQFKNYPRAKDQELLAAFREIGSAMEDVRLVAPRTFAFTGGNQELERLIMRTFGTTVFGPSFDRSQDAASFIETWVWGGTTAPAAGRTPTKAR